MASWTTDFVQFEGTNFVRCTERYEKVFMLVPKDHPLGKVLVENSQLVRGEKAKYTVAPSFKSCGRFDINTTGEALIVPDCFFEAACEALRNKSKPPSKYVYKGTDGKYYPCPG